MRSIIPVLFIIFPSCLLAQFKITGQIKDTQHKPVAFANVLLLDKDSTVQKAALSDENGDFEFADLKVGNYKIKVIMLGFEPFLKAVEVQSDQDLSVLTISESNDALGAVEITAKKPFLEQRAGMMVVNIANSIMGTDGSTVDVLKRVPGVVVVQDQIRLNGRTGVTILIDGRPTQYVDMNALLHDMPAANIERIEVISQPGAQYDAQGTAGVINIILKKNINLGLNGNVTAGFGYGRLPKYRFSGNINKRNDRFNVSGSVAFNHRSRYEELSLVRRVQNDVYQQDNYAPDYPYSLNLKGGVDYYLTDLQTIGINANFLGSKNLSTDENLTNIAFGSGIVIPTLLTTNKEDRRSGYASADAYYQLKLDTSGHRLDFDLSYSRYLRDKNNFVATGFLGQTVEGFSFPDRRQILPGGSNIVAAKLDYAKPLGIALKFETGVKISHAKLDNDFQSQILEPDGQWSDDRTQSNHFVFTEKIAAGYVNLKYAKQKWEAIAGLRYENALQLGNSITLDSTIERRFKNLFPTLSINVPIYKKIGLSAAYSYRIDRPSYNSLNPFVYLLDPYTYRQGNPFLRPELTHSTKVSVTYDKQPFLNFEHDRSKDVIQLISRQDDSTGVAYGYSENFERYEHTGGSMFFPLTFVKKLSGYGGGMLYYDRYRSGLFDDQLDKAAWNFTGFLQANYKFSGRVSAEITGWYRGSGVEGLMNTEDMYGMDAGIQVKMLDNQATLRMNCSNLFFKYFEGSMKFSNLDTDIVSRWETRVVNLSFTYNFGNQFLKKIEKRKGSSDDERKRNND